MRRAAPRGRTPGAQEEVAAPIGRLPGIRLRVAVLVDSVVRDAACPLSTRGGTRFVRLVRGRGGGHDKKWIVADAGGTSDANAAGPLLCESRADEAGSDAPPSEKRKPGAPQSEPGPEAGRSDKARAILRLRAPQPSEAGPPPGPTEGVYSRDTGRGNSRERRGGAVGPAAAPRPRAARAEAGGVKSLACGVVGRRADARALVWERSRG